MSETNIAARVGMRAALQLRKILSIPREVPINVFDLAAQLGVEVRFLDRPSLEGVFCREPSPMILLPSLKHRPLGRVAFSCGHELGHHQLNHGTRVDEYVEASRAAPRPPEEVTADTFAAHLLMPRPAVAEAFARRQLIPAAATPVQIYLVARELGVGYESLLWQLKMLDLITAVHLTQLRKTTPKEIRTAVVGFETETELALVDDKWFEVPVDLEVGDYVGVQSNAVCQPPDLLSRVADSRTSWAVFTATRPGVGAFMIGSKRLLFRVARRDYVGPFRNRFLEDPDAA